jgi:Restriction endonuclease
LSLETEAKLIMEVLNYDCEQRHEFERGVDLVASNMKSGEKALLRVLFEVNSDSEMVGTDDVKRMVGAMKEYACERGFMLGKTFSDEARRDMENMRIQRVSEKVPPRFEPEKLYLKIFQCVGRLCLAKCGKIPKRMSECNVYAERGYSCQIRQASDNASFHFERGWRKLLLNDLKRLVMLRDSLMDT